MTRQQVIGSLVATGSRDPDVLRAAKEGLLASARPLALLAAVPVLAGVLLSFTDAGPALGAPIALVGLWLLHRGRSTVRIVEGAYREYLGSLGLGARSDSIG